MSVVGRINKNLKTILADFHRIARAQDPVPQFDVPTRTVDLCSRYRETPSPDLLERILVLNFGLALTTARRYRTEVGIEDAFLAGCRGLMASVASFDPGRGAFSTHATYAIRQAIQEEMRKGGRSRLERVPEYMLRLAARVRKFMWSKEAEFGTTLTLDELRREFLAGQGKRGRITEGALARAYAIAREEPPEGLSEDHEEIADEQVDASEAAEAVGRILHLVQGVIDELPTRQATVLRERMKCMSASEEASWQREMAERCGVCEERIKQIACTGLSYLEQRLGIKSEAVKLVFSIQDGRASSRALEAAWSLLEDNVRAREEETRCAINLRRDRWLDNALPHKEYAWRTTVVERLAQLENDEQIRSTFASVLRACYGMGDEPAKSRAAIARQRRVSYTTVVYQCHKVERELVGSLMTRKNAFDLRRPEQISPRVRRRAT